MKADGGFGLIETMVSALILSIGVLGAVAMQAMAKRTVVDSSQRTQAIQVARDIVERVRTNTEAWRAVASSAGGTYSTQTIGTGSLTLPSCASESGVFADCSDTDIVLTDLYFWEKNLLASAAGGGSLAGARACYQWGADDRFDVVVSWQSRDAMVDAASDSANDSLKMTCGTASSKRRQMMVSTWLSR